MPNINLSQAPYFDNFMANDNFHQVLFRPAVAVQTRELNELQSILQGQIDKFGRNIFKDGSVVEGCSFSFDNRYAFVKITDTYANGTTFTIGNFKDYFLVNSNGLKAVIVNTVQGYQAQDPFTNVLYVKYLNSTTFANGQQQGIFSNSEVLSLQTDSGFSLGSLTVLTPNTANPNSVATGLGYAITVGAGIVFKNGYFTSVEPQTCIVDPFSNYPDGISVGFDVEENIITPEANTALCDNSVGSPNYLAPGAHRFQVIPVLTPMQTNNITNTTPFFSLCDFQSGVPITIKTDPQYALIGAEMARRTYETSGDFVVNPFILTTEPKNVNDPLFSTYDNLVSSLGLGYAKGYRNEFLASVVTPLKKAINYANALSTSTTTSFGSYVVISNFCGDFNISGLAQIELHNASYFAVSNNTFLSTGYVANNLIGCAYLRGLAFNNGYIGTGTEQYNAYLFNIRMKSGFSFSQVKGMVYRPSSSILGIADVIPQTLVVSPITTQQTQTVTSNVSSIVPVQVQVQQQVQVPQQVVVTNTVVNWTQQAIPHYPAVLTDTMGDELGNGNVITVGGFTTDGPSSKAVYTYCPNNNTWTSLPNIPIATGLCGVTELSNGSVIAGGGGSSTSAANSWVQYYRYDPGANTWTAIASSPLGVINFALSTLGNGSILQIGGSPAIASAPTANCYRYDPGANTWTQVANLPTALCGQGSATLSNGSVLSVTGTDTGFPGGWRTTKLCYRYDPDANTWTRVADYPLNDCNMVCARIANGNILGITGTIHSNSSILTQNCYNYDPGANSWAQVGSMPFPMAENGCAPFSNGNVLSFTGQTGWPTTSNTVVTNCYMYDCGANVWTQSIQVPTYTQISNIMISYITQTISVSQTQYQTQVSSVSSNIMVSNTVIVTNTVLNLIQPSQNKMIFPLGQKAIKLDGFSNESFVYRKRANSSFSNIASGVMTVSLGSPIGSAIEGFDNGGYLSNRAEESFIVTPTSNGITSNKTGTVNATSSNNIVTGSSTLFLSDYYKGDYIKINNYVNQISAVSNNSTLILTKPYAGTTALSNTHAKIFPKGVPISFNRSGRSVGITGNTATFTLGEALSGTFNTTTYFDIFRSYASPIKKNLKRNVHVRVDCGSHPNGTQGPFSLGFADVFRINKIYFSKGSYSNTTSNYSYLFRFDNGQRDDRYELASVSPIASGVLHTDSMLVVDMDIFTYNQSQGIGYFTGNSYPVDDVDLSNTAAIQTQYIPQYMSSDGSSFDLRDCVDFRPFANNSADSTANSINWSTTATENPVGNLVFSVNPSYGSFLPSPDRNYVADLEYYLPRIDKAVLTTGGVFTTIEGVPAPKPLPPLDSSKAMTIGVITVPPYPTLSTPDARISGRYDYAVTINLTQNQRFTMANIGSLSDRVKQLESYTSMNALEQSAYNTMIPSSQTGINRFQNGFVTDPFQGTNIADTLDPTFNCAIDSIRQEMRPAFSTFTKALWTNQENVPFDQNQYIFQNFSSEAINASASAWCYFGRIEVRPQVICSPDYFQDPDVSHNLDMNASWINISCRPEPNLYDWRNPYGTDWEHWRHYPPIIANQENSAISGNTDSYGNVLTEYQSRTTVNTAASGFTLNISQNYNSNGISIDTDVIDYTRCRDIDFIARGLKPNTGLKMFVGPYELTNLVRQCSKGFAEETFKNYNSTILSDGTGTVYGRVTLPSGYFKEGSIQFTLIDSTTQITTRADGYLQTSFTDSNNWKDIDICDQLSDYERASGLTPTYLPGQTLVKVADTPFLYNRYQGGNDLAVWKTYSAIGNNWIRFPSQSQTLNMDNDWNPTYAARDGFHSFDRKGSDVGRVSFNVVPQSGRR